MDFVPGNIILYVYVAIQYYTMKHLLHMLLKTYKEPTSARNWVFALEGKLFIVYSCIVAARVKPN